MAFGKYFGPNRRLVNIEIDLNSGTIDIWKAGHDQIREELAAAENNEAWADHLCWICDEFCVLADESAREPSGWEGIMPPEFYGAVTRAATISAWYSKYIGGGPRPNNYDVVVPFIPRERAES